MLKSPQTPSSTTESFATYVTRPFVENPNQEKGFFSNPKTSRPKWNQQYQDWSQTQNNVTPLKIFKTMGTSSRGILNDGNPNYKNISDAEITGMLGILRGDLGFTDRSCTKDESDIIARELLNIGRSIGASAVLMSDIEILEKAYRVETNIAKKQHLQISALLMLQGAQSKIEMTEWYLDGLQDRNVVLEKIHRYYMDAFLSNTTTVPITENTYEELVLKAKDKKWENVTALLSQLTVGSGDNRQNFVIEAVRLLNNYNKTHKNQSGDEMPPEIIHAGMLLNDESTHIRRKTAVFPQQKLDHYIADSRILQMYVGTEKEELSNSLRKTLSTWVQQNGNKWPEENINVAEQFFWNLNLDFSLGLDFPSTLTDLSTLTSLLFNIKFLEHPRNWKDFKDFANPYLSGVSADDKPYRMRDLLSIYQAFKTPGERETFLDFCEPYLAGVDARYKLYSMRDLLPIYQAFETPEERKTFRGFCKPYLAGVDARENLFRMRDLLPIYQAFETSEERKTYRDFCEHYLAGVDARENLFRMRDLLPIYQAFETPEERKTYRDFCKYYLLKAGARYELPHMIGAFLPIYQAFKTPEERKTFLDFCEPYLAGGEVREKLSSMRDLLSIYQAFKTSEERETFLTFCEPCFVRVRGYKIFWMQTLLPIYQAFGTPEERETFLTFCEPYLDEEDVYRVYEAKEAKGKISRMTALLSIYLSDRKEDFELFIRLHSTQQMPQDRLKSLISSYFRGAYLKEMRGNGALKAEGNPHESRRQSMYETILEGTLPILYAQDQFLQQGEREAPAMFANAHDFDPVYELDHPILWEQTEGYKSSPSSTPRTIYKDGAIIEYRTNAEVEDFISYLDNVIAVGPAIKIDEQTLNGAKVVSIIKQILGLERKSGNTTGGFLPYLSSSMYYAKSESPLGDEMLGRTWFYMTKIAKSEADKELNKRSVILAFLEANEISEARIDAHCQTRITGELMKLVALNNLPGSNLRPLIAGIDLPPVQSDADIEARITAAPFRAQQLFKTMRREDSGAIRRLLDHSYTTTGKESPLWQRYEAYYDDLYRRTKNEDGNGYKNDEHILTRDDHGNLVSLFNTDGTLRPQPIIVYHQAEFQVVEQTFTELMRQEFEEQRGLKYKVN